MKYLKYSLLFTLIIGIISFITLYLINHGKMQMDRIFVYSDDGSSLFIGEMTRQQLLGPIYIHSYEFNLYIDGKGKATSISFYSFSKDIEANNQLISFSEKHNYETTTSQLSLIYEMENKSFLNINSEYLNANFVTKTDPNYFRYMSNGDGTLSINKEQKTVHIISDTVISYDSSYAYLRKGTYIMGYMGGFWGTGGTIDYFDISKIVHRGEGETHEDHSYLLSLDGDQKAKKIYGLSVNEQGSDFLLLQNNTVILSANKNNIIKIKQGYAYDSYYYFIGKRGDGTPVGGFLNFVK